MKLDNIIAMGKFNMENDVSQVINRTALIENILDQVIIKYVSPRQEAYEFCWNVLLDSSIMQLGSKLKVVMAISEQLNIKLKKDTLHKVLSYRNAFAHHALNSHATLVVGKTPSEDRLDYMLHILSSSGKTERKSREDALEEFNQYYEVAKKELTTLLKKI